MEIIVAQGIIDLILNIVSNPGHWSWDDSHIVDLEVDIKCFDISGIIVWFLFNETVIVLIIDKDNKLVLWIGFVVNTNFCEGL